MMFDREADWTETTERGFEVSVWNESIITNPGCEVFQESDTYIAFAIDCKTKRGAFEYGGSYRIGYESVEFVAFAPVEDSMHVGDSESNTVVAIKPPEEGFWIALATMSRYTIFVSMFRVEYEEASE